MFSIPERDALRDRLIAAARADGRITAAAVLGSGATDGEDAWSDIGLALRLADGLEPDDVAAQWTTRIYESASAIDHLDVWSGSTLFRGLSRSSESRRGRPPRPLAASSRALSSGGERSSPHRA